MTYPFVFNHIPDIPYLYLIFQDELIINKILTVTVKATEWRGIMVYLIEEEKEKIKIVKREYLVCDCDKRVCWHICAVVINRNVVWDGEIKKYFELE